MHIHITVLLKGRVWWGPPKAPLIVGLKGMGRDFFFFFMGPNINVGINPTFLIRSSVVRLMTLYLRKISESHSNSPLYFDHGKINGSDINIFYFYFFFYLTWTLSLFILTFKPKVGAMQICLHFFLKDL